MSAVSRLFIRFVVGAALTTFVLIAGIGTASASVVTGPFPGEEGRFVNMVNAEREAVGLPALTVDPELTEVARRWSATMANRNLLAHNSNLLSQITADWARVGENVGYGSGVDYVMSLFLRSSTHYPNIVEPRFTHIGVGVVHDRLGRVWTTHQFMSVRTQATAPAVPAVAPQPAAAPAPVPTTAAPAPAPTTLPTTPTAAPATPVTVEPATIELSASYPAGYQNDMLPETHEVALAGKVVPMNERGHADALAMILFALAAGALAAALMLRLRGGS